ncbi:MAG TPA: hypothetical protein VF533_06675, partial [Solirubrobacteraceae bacterium]
MDPDLLRRVRWGNVAAAVGLLVLVALVPLWPRLSPGVPDLPPDAPAAHGGWSAGAAKGRRTRVRPPVGRRREAARREARRR